MLVIAFIQCWRITNKHESSWRSNILLKDENHSPFWGTINITNTVRLCTHSINLETSSRFCQEILTLLTKPHINYCYTTSLNNLLALKKNTSTINSPYHWTKYSLQTFLNKTKTHCNTKVLRPIWNLNWMIN